MTNLDDAMRAAIVANQEQEERTQSARMLGVVLIATVLFWVPTILFWFFG